MAGVLLPTVVAIDVRAFSSRSVFGQRDTRWRLVRVVGMHPVRDIDPEEPANNRSLLAFEWIQAAPHNTCLNDFAS